MRTPGKRASQPPRSASSMNSATRETGTETSCFQAGPSRLLGRRLVLAQRPEGLGLGLGLGDGGVAGSGRLVQRAGEQPLHRRLGARRGSAAGDLDQHVPGRPARQRLAGARHVAQRPAPCPAGRSARRPRPRRRCWPWRCASRRDGVGGARHADEGHGARGEQREELQRRGGDHAQRALGADQQLLQVIAGVVLAQALQAVPDLAVRAAPPPGPAPGRAWSRSAAPPCRRRWSRPGRRSSPSLPRRGSSGKRRPAARAASCAAGQGDAGLGDHHVVGGVDLADRGRMRSVESRISPCGIWPPTRPVLPPCGVIARPPAAQSADHGRDRLRWSRAARAAASSRSSGRATRPAWAPAARDPGSSRPRPAPPSGARDVGGTGASCDGYHGPSSADLARRAAQAVVDRLAEARRRGSARRRWRRAERVGGAQAGEEVGRRLGQVAGGLRLKTPAARGAGRRPGRPRPARASRASRRSGASGRVVAREPAGRAARRRPRPRPAGRSAPRSRSRVTAPGRSRRGGPSSSETTVDSRPMAQGPPSSATAAAAPVSATASAQRGRAGPARSGWPRARRPGRRSLEHRPGQRMGRRADGDGVEPGAGEVADRRADRAIGRDQGQRSGPEGLAPSAWRPVAAAKLARPARSPPTAPRTWAISGIEPRPALGLEEPRHGRAQSAASARQAIDVSVGRMTSPPAPQRRAATGLARRMLTCGLASPVASGIDRPWIVLYAICSRSRRRRRMLA